MSKDSRWKNIPALALRCAMLLSPGLLAGCGAGGDEASPLPPPATPQYSLTVATSGNGRVTSADGVIDCGTRCSAQLQSGTSVTLTASPDAGQMLQAWGGACAASTGSACTVSIAQATSVSVTFVASPPPATPRTLKVAVSGAGSVTSAPVGIDCPAACEATFPSGSTVTLRAVPASGALFDRWTGACSGTSSTCTLTLTAAAEAGATYLQDPGPEGWTTTAAIPGFIAEEVEAVIDAAGNSTAVWQGLTPANPAVRSVFASRSIGGRAWSAPVEIDASTTENAVAPQLGIDQASGRIIALWNSDSGLWARVFAPETGWGAATLVERKPVFQGAALRNYRVGVDGVGEAVAIWERNNELNTFSIWSSRYTLGNGWAAAVLVEDNDAFPFAQDVLPQLAVFGSGNAVAVWRSLGPNRIGYWTNTFNAASGWGKATELVRADARTPSIQFDLKADGRGNAILAWNTFEINASSQRVSSMYTRRFAGGAWQGGDTLVAPGIVISGTAASVPVLGLAPQGPAVLAWPLEDRALRASIATAAGAWGSASLVKPASGDVNLGSARTAMDDSGRGIAAWIQWRPSLENPQVWSSRYLPGSGWSAPTPQQDETSEIGGGLNLAMNGRGNALLLWLHGTQVRSRYFSPGR